MGIASRFDSRGCNEIGDPTSYVYFYSAVLILSMIYVFRISFLCFLLNTQLYLSHLHFFHSPHLRNGRLTPSSLLLPSTQLRMNTWPVAFLLPAIHFTSYM